MNFLEVLDRLGVPYIAEGHEHVRDGWIQLDCPWCSPNWQHWRLGYNLEGHYFSCWGCGYKRVADVLMEITGKEFREVQRFLKDLDFTYVKRNRLKETGTLVLPKGLEPLGFCHREYLIHDRKMDPDMIERIWQVQGIGLAPKLKWRLFIPIHYRGEIVSWTTRAVGKSGRRYISASPKEEKISHKRLLYGEDYVRHTVVIHEGPIDVWATGPGAVATFGTSFTREQILRLSRYPRRVVCLDSTSEGRRKAAELCDQLEPFPGETIRVIIDGKDVADSLKEAKRIRRLFLKD
jgi:hypothetical protein